MDTYDYMLNNINGIGDTLLHAEIRTGKTVRYAVDTCELNLEVKIIQIKRDLEDEYGNVEFSVKIERE